MYLKITHGELPLSIKYEQMLIVEGRDVSDNGSWLECESQHLSNARGYNGGTSCSSNDGSWGSLSLTSGHQYEFRVCYTYPDGTRSEYAVSNTLTYASSTQNESQLKQRIQNYLTNGLSAEEGEDKIYPINYDGHGLTANATAFRFNRPLYQMDLYYTGTTEDNSGNTLINFRVECSSRVAEGLEFRPEYVYYIGKDGSEQVQSLAGTSTTEEFSISLGEMGSGCNYLKLKLICYDMCGSGVDQYWTEEPIGFDIRPGATPLNTYSALTTKDTISLKPCTNYSGTLSYENSIPAAKGNVSESGVYVWYRKKGASSWTKKTFKGTAIPKIKSLKQDTVYEWKAQYYIKSKMLDGTPWTITSPVTKVFKVCTAVSAKPQVKSCKVTGAKVVKHQIDGHWESTGSGLKWVKTKVWYTTDFKVTYTFKNPSKNVVGYTSDGVYSKVKSGKVTFSMSVNTGTKKAKAKTFTANLQSCTNINGPGVSVSGLSAKLKYTGKI